MNKRAYTGPTFSIISLRLEERLAACDPGGGWNPGHCGDSGWNPFSCWLFDNNNASADCFNPGHCGGSSQWSNAHCGGSWNHIHCPGGNEMQIS